MKSHFSKYSIHLLVFFIFIQNAFANLIPVKGSDVFMHSDVLSVVQDQEGYMWFASFDGLYRYDGNEMKVFKHVEGDSLSLASNRLISLAIDKKDRVIIGTEANGLCIYDKKKNQFKNIPINGDQQVTIHQVFCDKSGNIWVGSDYGLSKIREDEEGNCHILSIIDSNIRVRKIIEGKNELLWALTSKGLYTIHPNTLQIVHHILRINKEHITTIYVDKKGTAWAGTFGGLYQINRQFKPKKKYINASILSIYMDKENTLWVGTKNKGLMYSSDQGNKFIPYQPYTSIHPLHNNKAITTFCESREGILWLGSLSNGAFTNEKSFRYLEQFKNPYENNPNTLFSSYTFYQDQDSILWVGTLGQGLGIFNRKTGEVVDYKTQNPVFKNLKISKILPLPDASIYLFSNQNTYHLTKQDQNDLINGQNIKLRQVNPIAPYPKASITYASIDEDQHMWLSTNAGLYEYIPSKNDYYKGKVNRYRTHGQLGLTHKTVKYVVTHREDHIKYIWIGTKIGLNLLKVDEKKKEKTIAKFYKGNGVNDLPSNFIASLIKGKDNTLWIGCLGGGLVKCPINPADINAPEFTKYTEKEGIITNQLEQLQLDQKGQIWMSGYGLSKFNPSTLAVENYEFNSAIRQNFYKIRRSYYSPSNELFFGSDNGFILFKPSKYHASTENYTPSFTTLKVNDQEIKVGKSYNGNEVLSHPLGDGSIITLAPQQDNIEIGFTGFCFHSQKDVTYKYRMSDVDKDWVESSDGYAMYRNLPYGEHTFELLTHNGKWMEEPVKLYIHLKAPFYLTTSAYIVYFLLLIGSIFTYYHWKRTELERTHEQEIVELKEQETENIQKAKLDLFTFICHDMKTPLTLILDPIQDLIYKKELKPEVHHDLQVVRKNAVKLQKLVLELMDFQKFENKEMRISPQEVELNAFVRQTIHHFQILSEKRNIKLSLDSDQEEIIAFVDSVQFEKVIFNLVSNALQYTPQNGEITLGLKEHKDTIEIAVKDTGVGIDKEVINNVFDPYFQQKTSGRGSGIGLAVTKSIVEQHSGKIAVQSEKNQGSTFTIQLLKGNSHFDKIYTDQEQLYIDENSPIVEEANAEVDTLEVDEELKGAHILIVDDNEDITQYLNIKFSALYNVSIANDGTEALKIVNKKPVDLIISDITMDEMNGLEFCKSIKEQSHTSHIPVIFLSAKDDVQTQLTTYNMGADAFISKPFSFDILSARVKNLLSSNGAPSSFEVSPSAIEISSKDEQLLEEAMMYIEQNLENSDLNVEHLCKELGVSRSQLYRKVKTMTNMSISEFIRTIRLKRAAQILQVDGSSILDVMDKVGFNNPSYFTRTFKKQFGVSPKEYSKQFSSKG
ncbi:two-component regulator propeller domain-containing protein [Flammeovirga sp. EKP202]|uniref:two-component regulator propeller domain-containing protein n=1 Tax=Flammeovirga sp. EKP202 TaxID=2770592 RepID=UPI00165EF857|nr:two-component regulator propeller domain-containing protein [Flammeovirga sp. EKP202]MBD0401985.1 response regulator [Flammeovirga sp. EKP202]